MGTGTLSLAEQGFPRQERMSGPYRVFCMAAHLQFPFPLLSRPSPSLLTHLYFTVCTLLALPCPALPTSLAGLLLGKVLSG